MTVYFELTSAEGTVARMALQPGLQRIKAAIGDRYRIYDEETGKSPPDIVVKRLDSHMIVDGLPGDAQVELSDFYARCGVSSPCTFVVDTDTVFSTGPVEISPASPPLQALTDGSFVLYPSGYSGVPAIAVADSEGFPRAAAYAVGGLALVGLAAAGGGGGGDSAGPAAVAPSPPAPAPAPAPPPPSGAVDNVPPDQPVVTSEKTSDTRTPTIAGSAEAGAAVRLDIDVDRDGRIDASFITIADAEGQWQIDLATQPPASGTLPGAGLPVESPALMMVTAIDSDQNQSSAMMFELVVDIAPLASVTAVTDNAAPLTGNVANGSATNDATPTISGTLSAPLESGERLQVFRNGAAITATVAVDGDSWRVTDSRLADGNYTYTARVSDAEGAGPTSAGFRITVDTENSKTASITSITDNVSPGLGTVRDNDTTNDSSPTLNGLLSSTLAADEDLQILRDDTLISTSATISGRNWSFTDQGLDDGNYDYSVRIVDAAGNLGRESATYDVRVRLQGNADANANAADDALPIDSSQAGAPLAFDDLVGSVLLDGASANSVDAPVSVWMAPNIDSLVNAGVLA